MLQIDLFKTVLDPASLDIFWMELTSGAYGEVDRPFVHQHLKEPH